MEITQTRKGSRVGVNRDGEAIGYAVKTSRAGTPERWTAFVYTPDPPFDACIVGFASDQLAVAYIAKNGHPR